MSSRTWGYGLHRERWLIDRYNIKTNLRCNSDGVALPVEAGGYPDDWDLLVSDLLEKEYALESDPRCTILVMCMAVECDDDDGVTDNAYKFWRRCRFKGHSTARAKLITKTPPPITLIAATLSQVRVARCSSISYKPTDSKTGTTTALSVKQKGLVYPFS